MRQEGSTVELALPFLRPAVLLWLATVGPDDWVALDDLAAHLRASRPAGTGPRSRRALHRAAAAAASADGPRRRGRRGATPDAEASPTGRPGVLESLLLGAAYQLGLVRVGRGGAQRPAGRPALAAWAATSWRSGPPPPPRPTFEHFLFVQPNFEIIAYRQGLTPALIGQFSRFAQWSQIGAALELKLTPESVYRGLEGGLTTQAMLDRLARHSPRPLPGGRGRGAADLGRSPRARDLSRLGDADRVRHARRPGAGPDAMARGAAGPPRCGSRTGCLLVEDESAIPFQRFRLAGSRDYRRAPEACLEVEPDGVIADARPGPLRPAGRCRARPVRRRAAVAAGPSTIARQPAAPVRGLAGVARRGPPRTACRRPCSRTGIVKRTGAEMPAAVRLLLLAAAVARPPRSRRAGR